MDAIVYKLLILPGIIIGLAFHEFAHAAVANALGDDTAKRMGRLTLDPVKHIDVMGLIMLIVAGFGWGKPVPVDERNFKHPGRDGLLVSIAGPIMNLLVATGFVIIFKVIVVTNSEFFLTKIGDIIRLILIYAININIVLMVFNLIPVPPLDGYHILSGIADFRGKGIHYKLYEKGRMILLGIVAINLLGFNLLGRIIGPPIDFIRDNLIGLFF